MTIRAVICAVLLGAGTFTARGQTDETAIADMIAPAAAESARRCAGRIVQLAVAPEDAPPIVWQVFSAALLDHGATVKTDARDVSACLTVDLREMKSSAVSIDNSSYFKMISLSMGVMLEDRVRDTIEWSKEFSPARVDTLRGDRPYNQRDFLEESSATWTESLLTPVTVTATAIVLIVLLFTVRGS